MSRALGVWSNGVRVGGLFEQDDLWAFEYDPEWRVREEGFDISPALPRTAGRIVDGATVRPVQWYFDNLLPEDRLREVLAKEARVPAQDSFGLLAYFGAESAGSLVLLDPDRPVERNHGLRELPPEILSRRIRNLPTASLTHDAPKKMSLAGAQHKLLVVVQDGQLFEPLGATPSTHILKPQHQSDHYPASVMNEYFTMRLAARVGLEVPHVERRYVPEPIYLVQRFDRQPGVNGNVDRLHVIDTCQLLNKSPSYKYLAANVDAFQQAIECCLGRAAARQRLFEWMVFNVLMGNGDNHLKNISFMVDRFGIHPAPAYDLLCTAVYETRAMTGAQAAWPHTRLAFSFGKVERFSDVTRASLMEAGEQIGLAKSTIHRILDSLIEKLPRAATALIDEIVAEDKQLIEACPDPERARQFSAGDQRMLRSLLSLVLRDMLTRMN